MEKFNMETPKVINNVSREPKEEKITPKSQIIEREPPRIVGGAPERAKKIVQEQYQGYFYEDHLTDISEENRKKLESAECEKSLLEIKLINTANDELNNIIEKFGIKPFDIPEKNIHIIPSDLYDKLAGTGKARAVIQQGAIYIDEKHIKDDPLYFGHIIFHELAHLKGFFSLEVEGKEETLKNVTKDVATGIRPVADIIKQIFGKSEVQTETTMRRNGLMIYPAQKSRHRRMAFIGLEEAVVAKMQDGYIKKLVQNHILPPENIKNQITDHIEDYIETKGSYGPAKKVLDLLTSEIYEKNKDKFGSKEDALNVFVRAHFDGNILTMTKLIKDVFGKEGLEDVAWMLPYEDRAEETLKFLNVQKESLSIQKQQ